MTLFHIELPLVSMPDGVPQPTDIEPARFPYCKLYLFDLIGSSLNYSPIPFNHFQFHLISTSLSGCLPFVDPQVFLKFTKYISIVKISYRCK